MDGLLLEGLPGIPRVRVEVGKQAALVVADAATARQCADLIVAIKDPPDGVVLKNGVAARLVPAEGGLLPHLTVLGNVVHGHTAAHRVTRQEARDLSRETARNCGLGDVLKRYPHEITSGRRRQAGVARALRAHPTVLVLEDAPGLPTWGSLLRFDSSNPELSSPAVLLITTDANRTAGFHLVTD